MQNCTEEILDIVDLSDNIIGSLPRSEIYKKGNCIIRGAWLFIQNSEGKLWIPRRTKTKKLNPDALDGSVVGHVESGEDYLQTILREAKEEVNLDLSENDIIYVGSMGPDQLAELSNGIRAFIKVYILKSDVTPDFNREDFYEYYWLTTKELLERIEKGDKHKPSLPLVVKHIFCKKKPETIGIISDDNEFQKSYEHIVKKYCKALKKLSEKVYSIQDKVLNKIFMSC